jgi:hypothetical protein
MSTSGIFNLDQNLISSGFLDGNGSVSVEITNQTNPTALHKITTNEALGNDEFIVDNVEAKAGAGASGITFLSGAGKVGFQASGDVYAELGVFPDPTSSTFTTALGPVADTKFTLPPDPNLSVVMLRWGADAAASGTGSIALGSGVGTVDFSAGGTGELFFCVLQQLPRTTPTDDALASVVKNWKLPVHVQTGNDLAPRTYLLSEVGGSLKASISATFGHEFNWIRQIKDGPITGDIGLKLQLGLTAAFGLQTQGRYAVVVSRETNAPAIRVRIYKLKLNGFDFALTAGVSATPSVPAPGSFDDLVEATLGVHALQIMNDLEDPNAIDNWINQFGPVYVTALLKKLTGLDLPAAITKITDLVNRWKSLPSSAASLFVKLAEKGVPDFSDIRQAAQLIANKDEGGLKTFLQDKIQDLNSPLLTSPLGQFLEGLTEEGALTLLQNIPDNVQQAAQGAVSFLSGAPIENLLSQVVTEIDSRLGLNAILADLAGDPATVMDKLLFSKLTAFLARTPALKDIQELQTTIKTLLGKASDLYAKTVKALNSTYSVQLNATHQKTTTDTALIDATFSFSDPGVAPGVAASLHQLMAGQLDDFLTKPRAGVTLASGALTHQVKRHSHVDLTLPFLTAEADWISNATANYNAIDENDGRLTMYQLGVSGTQVDKDTFTSLWTGRNWRSTSIALSGQISALLKTGGQLRVFADTETDRQKLATSTASVRLEVSNMSLNQLELNVEPFAVQFLRGAFPDNATFERWAATGKLLTKPANTLVSLDILLPPPVPLAWLKNTTIDPKNQVYKDLSLTLQAILKRYLRDYYFRDINKYDSLATAYLVLLYAAIPPSNSIVVDGNVSSVLNGVYWDTADINAVRGMTNAARDSTTAQGFKAQISQAQARLLEAGKTDPAFTNLASFYDPRHASVGIFNSAVAGPNMGLLKDSLLFVESNVISGARDAALDAANFNNLSAANKPVEALEALAGFGNKLTEAFNKDLSSVFVQDNDALQRLSPLIFAQASTVFDPSVPITNYDSTLNVTVLKQGATMPTDFPDFTPAAADILVSLNAASFGL